MGFWIESLDIPYAYHILSTHALIEETLRKIDHYLEYIIHKDLISSTSKLVYDIYMTMSGNTRSINLYTNVLLELFIKS